MAIMNEIIQLERYLEAINPKVSLYKEIEVKKDKLIKILDQINGEENKNIEVSKKKVNKRPNTRGANRRSNKGRRKIRAKA